MRRRDIPSSIPEIQQVLADCQREIIATPVPDVASTVRQQIQGNQRQVAVTEWHDEQVPSIGDSVLLNDIPDSRFRKVEALKFIAASVAIILLAGTLIVAFQALTGQSDGALGGGFWTSTDRSVAYAVIVDDFMGEQTFISEVVAFDEASGEVIARFEAGDQPDLVPDPERERIYLLQTHRDSPSNGTQELSAIDTRTWDEIASTTTSNRVTYTFTGPSSLVLSPDGLRLLVYSSNELGDYWLQVFDAETLQRVSGPEGIALPRGCGGTQIVTTRTEVVLICGIHNIGVDGELIQTPLAVHFIDVNAGEIATSIPIPISRVVSEEDAPVVIRNSTGAPWGMVVADGGSTIYLIFANLGIMEIDTTRHEITRDVTTWLREDSGLFGIGLSSDSHLLVGVWSNRDLLRLALPSLDLLATISLPDGSRFVPGSDNDLYTWVHGTTDLRRMDLEDGSEMEISLSSEKDLISDIVRP